MAAQLEHSKGVLTVFSWFIRILMIVAGAMAEWLIARGSPRFQLVELGMSFFLVLLMLYVAAFWPARWSEYLNSMYRKWR
ncbi:MAG: hypothetical protein ISP45_14480 [Reyranella sp.]|nr:hypothetical protein [Reyranella sp.]